MNRSYRQVCSRTHDYVSGSYFRIATSLRKYIDNDAGGEL